MLVAIAIGESLWPKHTGHASATRGAASSQNATSVTQIARCSSSRQFLVFRWNAAP